MPTHEHSIVVDRPVRTVYDQWTQLESYPLFMAGVEAVQQTNDETSHWRVKVNGVTREYDARIREQKPDELISWVTLNGPHQAGAVRFEPVTPEQTRVTLTLEFDPEGVAEHLGETFGAVDSSITSSLEQFRDFIEDRETATGSWRGTVHDGSTTSPDDLHTRPRGL